MGTMYYSCAEMKFTCIFAKDEVNASFSFNLLL